MISAARPSPARWVLLRGLGREAGHWAGFPQTLRAAFPGELVLTPDLPGCGSRCRETAPLGIAGLVESVRADLGLADPGGEIPRAIGPTWLLGLSLGAMVALEWTRRHPEEIAGAVLVNGSTASLSPFWRRLRPAALLSLARAALARTPTTREQRIFGITSARPERAAAAIPAWVDLAQQHPVKAANVGRMLLSAATYRPTGSAFRPGVSGGAPASSAITPPLLVVVGAGDRLTHPTCSGRLAEALRVPLAVHPSAGHELPLDDPAWLVAELVRWRSDLRKVSPERHTVTIG